MRFTVIQPDPMSWDRFVTDKGGSLLQLSRWGELKSAFGWSSETVSLESKGVIVAGCLVLFRQLPLGLGSIAYVPRGPVVDWSVSDVVQALFTAIDGLSRRHRAAFLKIEPHADDSPGIRQILAAQRFVESRHTIQPPNSIAIDVTGTDDQILARMNQGTRRKIRTAVNSQIKVRHGSVEDMPAYSKLAQITGERDGFGVHSHAYYQTAFELFSPNNAVLLMASLDQKDVAGLMAFALGDTAWYLYGASSNEAREQMPNFGLQWEAIKWARSRGCKRYDLWGIPDEPESELEAEFQQRRDGLWGVYGFKRGFGGTVWRTAGAWDRAYSPLLYFAYTKLVGSRD